MVIGICNLHHQIRTASLRRATVIRVAGDVAGFPPEIADKLIERKFAVLHGDGKPKPVGHKIPDINGYVSGWGSDQLAKQG
jgi:hypothetical protein